MVLVGTVTELAQQVLGAGYHVRLRANGRESPFIDELRQLKGVLEVEYEDPDQYTLVAAQDLRAEAARAVIQAGGKLLSLDIESLSLDDIYNTYFKEVKHGPRS
jgi:ABC-2 type transport system ATP-binding protein